MSGHERERDNATGRFDSDEYAEAHPDETTTESTLDKGGDEQVDRSNASGRFVSEQAAEDDPDGTSVDHV